MKCEKINNYRLTGSIHTLQIKSSDIPEQISLAKKYVAEKHQDYSNNHILLIYLMSGRKSTLKNIRKTKIKQSKSYLTYGFLNRSYIITKK